MQIRLKVPYLLSELHDHQLAPKLLLKVLARAERLEPINQACEQISVSAKPLQNARAIQRSDGLAEDEWLWLDWVNLMPDRDALFMTEKLQLNSDDLTHWVSVLNQSFGETRLIQGVSGQCYIRNEWADAFFVPTDEVVGRHIDTAMPKGEAAQAWRQLSNEIQMVLHMQESIPANSIWPWSVAQANQNTRWEGQSESIELDSLARSLRHGQREHAQSATSEFIQNWLEPILSDIQRKQPVTLLLDFGQEGLYRLTPKLYRQWWRLNKRIEQYLTHAH